MIDFDDRTTENELETLYGQAIVSDLPESSIMEYHIFITAFVKNVVKVVRELKQHSGHRALFVNNNICISKSGTSVNMSGSGSQTPKSKRQKGSLPPEELPELAFAFGFSKEAHAVILLKLERFHVGTLDDSELTFQTHKTKEDLIELLGVDAG